ncbi:MAG: hypothetical protein LBT89_01950, partial [Planctomycetaceae bacterium]|nr:hypothetical protein [Planctomycetaceae bacterium]
MTIIKRILPHTLTCLLVILTGTFALAQSDLVEYGVYVDSTGASSNDDDVTVNKDETTITVTNAITESDINGTDAPFAGFVIDGVTGGGGGGITDTSGYIFNALDGISLSGNTLQPIMGFLYATDSDDSPFAGELNVGTITVENSGGGGANGLLFLNFPGGTAANLSGSIINVGDILLTSTGDAAASTSTGFFAGMLANNSHVTLGMLDDGEGHITAGLIEVISSGSAKAVSAVTIGGIEEGSSLSVGTINVELETDTDGQGTAARGIYIKDQTKDSTGTGTGDVAGDLIINGDITVTATGNQDAYARGIEIEGSVNNLIIKHNVIVTSDEDATIGKDFTSAVYVEKGADSTITVD